VYVCRYIAVERCRTTVLPALLQAGVDINAPATSENGVISNLLALAISFHQPDMVDLLLLHQADINVRPNGRSMLEIAVDNEDVVIVRKLVSAGADCTLHNTAESLADDGQQPLLCPLFVAVSKGNSAIVRLLLTCYQLDLLTPITSPQQDSMTALHLACKLNKQTIVFLIMTLEHADVGSLMRSADALGRTPIDVAAQCKHANIVALLSEFNST
jgi:ankyrin repeat protein